MNLVKEIFEESFTTFASLDKSFNLALVVGGVRKATLFQISTDYLPIKEWLLDNKDYYGLDILELVDRQILIFRKGENIGRLESVQDMGNVLGMKCAGEVNGNWGLSFIVEEKGRGRGRGKQEDFYAETCHDCPDMDNIQKKLLEFQRIAQIVNVEVRYEITYNMQGQELLELIKRGNLSRLYDLHYSVANLLWNFGFKRTEEIFNNINSLEELSILFSRYQKVWIAISCFIVNEPFKVFYPLSEETDQVVRNEIQNLEELWYSTLENKSF